MLTPHNLAQIRNRLIRGVLAILAVCSAAMTVASPAQAQTDPALLGRAIDATVQLSIVVDGVVDGEAQVIWFAAGSGTIVSPDGLILTNQHLITPAGIGEKMAELEAQLDAEGKQAELEVDPEHFMVAVSDGRHLPVPRFTAAVAAEDAELDLAVLRIEGDERGQPLDPSSLGLPVLPLGISDAVNLGETVHVFGFPAIGSGSLTYTLGIVSGFLFEDEIDGTAWINTDAVTSGGNSGGAAVNAAGELIGVPTSGSSLDCRPGDTNRDGVEGPGDVGCVPTGGSLTQLRPVDLAKPLLATVDADIAASVGASATVSLTPPADEPAASLAAAEGCAARGDWRCAANFFGAAQSNAPDDAAILASLYEAYLQLGQQEAAAGRLESARSAFSSAVAADPTRAEAQAALDRLKPYDRALVVDGFDGQEHFVAASDEGSTSRYVDGGFRLEISQPGLASGYPLTDAPLVGEDFAALLRIGAAAGDGLITIETRTDPAGGQWIFGVDPTRLTWEVLQFDVPSARFVPWGGPYRFDTGGKTVATIELRVSDGFPMLLINGLDAAATANTSLPEVGNHGEISFGAVMASEGETPFIVSFDEVGLYELA